MLEGCSSLVAAAVAFFEEGLTAYFYYAEIHFAATHVAVAVVVCDNLHRDQSY